MVEKFFGLREGVLGERASLAERQKKDWREVLGQVVRLIGASTKTPFGVDPTGNTGGANVSPFRPMPVPEDLQEKIRNAQRES